MTPEEQKWRKKAFSPDKAKRVLKFQYILLGCWIALSIAWLVAMLYYREFSWPTLILFVFGYVNCILGITNNKRINVGKKPL
ncbi:hypothetical protein [uncultured Alistipes sp.]|jgi:hypothetical protein|uniref:hypothetical protein n=1 Tax=uncultured Alistipes sp. TaxID=538949 RepID=UPI0020453A31|nr:hypothetical protein [uncultured Alistipes sp.]DAN30547.1 MAG TPA: hypothetical protein [Crassvirales sp.]